MILSISVLFLISILHYYGATSTTDPPQCNACCQGQPGLPGNGVPGVPGVPGMPGLMGPKGDIGDPGTVGASGLIRPAGGPGQEGRKGNTGASGLQGLPGKVGPRGHIGAEGLVGDKGDKGDTGQIHQSAFTVLKTTAQQGSGPGIVVTFDEMSLNLGNDFNLDTGKFTCRVAGAYVFEFGVGIRTHSNSIISLIKNGDVVLRRIQVDNKGAIQGGTVIQLQAGDEIWLDFTNIVHTYHHRGSKCYFYGYLLYET